MSKRTPRGIASGLALIALSLAGATITSPAGRSTDQEQSTVAFCMLRVGDPTESQFWLDRAVQSCSAIASPADNARARCVVVEAAVAMGAFDAAVANSQMIEAASLRLDAMLSIAVAMAERGNRAGARALLTEVTPLLKEIENASMSEMYHQGIALAHAGAGDFDAAKAMAAQITDPWTRASTFSSVSEALLEAGDMRGATDLAAQIGKERFRSRPLFSIAQSLAAKGDLAGARSMLERINDPISRAVALHALSAQVAQGSDQTGSESLAEVVQTLLGTLDDPRDRVAVFTAFARQSMPQDAQAAHRYLTLAQGAVSAIAESNDADAARHDIAIAQISLADCEGALRTTASISDKYFAGQALTAIARQYSHVGNYAAAVDAASRSPEAWGRNRALADVACLAAGAGALPLAAETTSRIDWTENRVRPLASIGAAYATAGDHTAATEFFRLARQAANEVELVLYRAEAMAEITRQLAKAGLVSEARTLAMEIPDLTQLQPWRTYVREESVRAIAASLATSGSTQVLRDWFDGEPDPRLRAYLAAGAVEGLNRSSASD